MNVAIVKMDELVGESSREHVLSVPLNRGSAGIVTGVVSFEC